MPKNDFESTNFANFEEVVRNFGRSDDLLKKILIFNICRRGLMPNLIKKSWTVSSVYTYSSYVAKNIRVKGKVVFRNVQMALK